MLKKPRIMVIGIFVMDLIASTKKFLTRVTVHKTGFTK